MAKVKEIVVGINDRIGIGAYSSVSPSIQFRIELDEGDDPVKVREAYQKTVTDMWERDLCNRLADHIALRNQLQGAKPLDGWIYTLHNFLFNKHYATEEANGGTSASNV